MSADSAKGYNRPTRRKSSKANKIFSKVVGHLNEFVRSNLASTFLRQKNLPSYFVKKFWPSSEFFCYLLVLLASLGSTLLVVDIITTYDLLGGLDSTLFTPALISKPISAAP